MVRVVALDFGARRNRRGASRSRAARPGAARYGRGIHRLIHPFELAELHCDIMRAHSEEAADADHDGVDLPTLIGHQFLDVADLLVLRIINVHADQLRALPQARRRSELRFWRIAGAALVGGLRQRRRSDQGRADHGCGQPFRKHWVSPDQVPPRPINSHAACRFEIGCQIVPSARWRIRLRRMATLPHRNRA